MSEGQDYRVLATGLADMARALLETDSVQETLDQVAAHAVTLVGGCEAAGILTVRRGEVSTLAATDDVVRASDRMQASLREGPCFDATVHQQRVHRISDMAGVGSRWPRYARQAREIGIGSMMGFLLYTNGRDNLGALNFYSPRRNAFGEPAEHVGWVLASHAAVALYAARHAQNMDIALTTSRSIGEAIGIIMSRYKLTEQQAFDQISSVSQKRNVKIRELAQTITETGEIPNSR